MMRIGIFDLAEQRLAWTDQRQAVLAANIANIDTPGYQPRDLPPFAQSLRTATAGTALAQTRPGHLAGSSGGPLQAVLPAQPALHGPDGNAVSLDEQIEKVADTTNSQTLVTSIYSKYMSLFAITLGRS